LNLLDILCCKAFLLPGESTKFQGALSVKMCFFGAVPGLGRQGGGDLTDFLNQRARDYCIGMISSSPTYS
jgi:hypothetical protein